MTLQEAFAEVEDHRRGPARQHDLKEMIVMSICAVLCGADGWVDVADWCEGEEDWLKTFLVLANGTPSHDTFGNVFRVLDATVFERCFRCWVSSIIGVAEGVVALDGKTLRGSKDGPNTAVHMVSAYATALGVSLGQAGVAGKGNELAAIKALLESLVLKGCIVTIDALGCQTEIAKKIVDQGGDYMLAVKDNQKNLSQAVVEFFDTAEAFDYRNVVVQKSVSVEKNHGRIETRRVALVADVSWMDKPMREHWQKLAAVGMIESVQEMKDKVSVERRYFIMSAGVKTVAQFARAARAHWGIESMHWVLDVTFREDDCRVRKGHAAQNFSAIRKFAITALRTDTRHPDRSLRRRRKLADRRPEYRVELLGINVPTLI
ncbi:MAG: ISAs1 family transposase [Azonexus sp.]|uniref:ISAs1 family transposase n=1 Tax=Hydrogenophaga sp. TaxID=1904254 RepID=UPI002766530C|nr:ISAs1 family transposase [Hydrogenophaga sp.]MDP3638422.1 ISAs1 family transposase [Azonexus sp.]MDZ4280647.1 ISAs1 family transposase [Hydrogenophaga sp.]